MLFKRLKAHFNLFLYLFLYFCAENEIDGTGFFDLDESDIKSMVSKLGIVKKISRLQKLVRSTLFFLLNHSMDVTYCLFITGFC